MIAGPVLSPCSFHSSWSCAALRQGLPASRDQLTDQEQCEAAKRITTRAKILSIDGPKTKRQKRSGFQGRQSGPPQKHPEQCRAELPGCRPLSEAQCRNASCSVRLNLLDRLSVCSCEHCAKVDSRISTMSVRDRSTIRAVYSAHRQRAPPT